MENLNASMGYVVNEDGSITRINSTQSQSSHSPNFIPVSLMRYGGLLKRFWFFLALSVICFIHVGIGFYSAATYNCQGKMNDRYESYIRYRDENNEREANYYYWRYQLYKGDRYLYLGGVIVCLISSIVLDCWAVPRLRRTYSDKKKILKGVEYIQSDLSSNHSYPYIMTNNLIGVFSMRKAKIIIPPNYDDIRWVIPKKVFCAERQGKKMFYDINGDILNNVPQSYYNS